MFLAAKEFPLPVEYRFLPLEEVFHEPPADVVDRTLVFLDCGNIDRMPVEFLQRDGARLLNIDHHHDNTRFGTVNLVDTEASCTAEIVLEIAQRLGRRDHAGDRLGALRRAGHRHRASSCTRTRAPTSHRMAAELIEAGVDVNDTYRRLYERVPIEKLRLIARALEKIERFDDGRVAVTYIAAADYAATGAGEVLTEGIIDFLRSLEGTDVAAVDPRQDRRRALGAQGQPALDRRRGRRLGDRPHPRRRRAPARRRVRQRPALPRAGRVPARRGRRAARLSRRPAGAVVCSSTSRRGSPRTTSSPGCGAPSRPRAATPARSTRSRPGC